MTPGPPWECIRQLALARAGPPARPHRRRRRHPPCRRVSRPDLHPQRPIRTARAVPHPQGRSRRSVGDDGQCSPVPRSHIV